MRPRDVTVPKHHHWGVLPSYRKQEGGVLQQGGREGWERKMLGGGKMQLWSTLLVWFRRDETGLGAAAPGAGDPQRSLPHWPRTHTAVTRRAGFDTSLYSACSQSSLGH